MGRQSLSGSSSGFRNNFNRKREEKDGCLVAISTFTALSLIIWLYGKAGTAGFIYILFLTAAFAFLYGLFLFYKTKTNARKAGEAVSLYQKGEYREAYAVALSISGQNCDAALIAGLCLRSGKGCDQDHDKAFRCFKFARSRSMEARAYYGEMLTIGTGCARDVVTGFKELEVAAANDIPYANLCMGRLLFNGTLMKKNISSAMRNLRIAAEAGLPGAQYIVGYILYNGLEGIPQNSSKGLQYLNCAASAGNLRAKRMLQKMG